MTSKIAALLLLAVPAATAQVRREVAVPDIPGFKTLVCDLHMHSVFSDGQVWPTVRVDEAWRTGLDAIAISDHIEYQPHAADLPTNHHRPYELMEQRAKQHNLILIRAAEITRNTPPGHFNALFLDNINALQTPDFVEAVRQAGKQNAFIFWNHHDWHGVDKGGWLEVHQQLFDEKLLHGMEIANGNSYYPRAHRWCLDRNLTLLGNSDIHEPDLRTANTSADHRTCTLVFTNTEGTEGIRQALIARRTAVWYADRVIGRREWLEPLAAACFQVDPPHHRAGNDVWFKVHNRSPFALKLTRTAGPGPQKAEIAAHTTSLFKVRLPDPATPTPLAYTIDNFEIEPAIGLPVTHTLPAMP